MEKKPGGNIKKWQSSLHVFESKKTEAVKQYGWSEFTVVLNSSSLFNAPTEQALPSLYYYSSSVKLLLCTYVKRHFCGYNTTLLP